MARRYNIFVVLQNFTQKNLFYPQFETKNPGFYPQFETNALSL